MKKCLIDRENDEGKESEMIRAFSRFLVEKTSDPA